jgi:hypothetical protein
MCRMVFSRDDSTQGATHQGFASPKRLTTECWYSVQPAVGPNDVVEPCTLLLHIREVPGSNLSSETKLQANAGIST